MTYLPWWMGGLALSLVAILHFFSTRRMMAISGRFTALINRLRSRTAEPVDMSEAELLAALAAATSEEFGPAAVAPMVETPFDQETQRPRKPLSLAETPPSTHLLFFISLALGGLLSAAWTGAFALAPTLRSASFAEFFGDNTTIQLLVLLAGGLCVGFGTRMAGGCTSGHGLCGVSRLEPGSLLATAAFFGAGIFTSFALGWWS